MLSDRLNKAESDIADIIEAEKQVAALKNIAEKTLNDVKAFKVFGENQSDLEKGLEDLKKRTAKVTGDAKKLLSDTDKKYSAVEQSVPSDLAQALSSLELLTETLNNAMDEKDREFKRARTVRYDYSKDVDDVQSWLQKAELQIQDRTLEPEAHKERLQHLQSEIGPIGDKLERLTKNGRTIIENSQDDSEKDLIRSTIDNLTDQMAQVKSLLEDRKQKVGDSLDAWARFFALNEAVRQWVETQREFLAQPMHLTTLQQTRQKLSEYSVRRQLLQFNSNRTRLNTFDYLIIFVYFRVF